MGLKTGNALFFYSGFLAMALIGLSSSIAYCQNRPTPSPAQTWLDPGAMEKARSEAGTQGQNKEPAPSPAAPAVLGRTPERLPSPSLLKPAKNIQTSSIAGGERLSKSAHDAVEHKAAHASKHRVTLANHASSSGTAPAHETGHKVSAGIGRANGTPGLRSQMAGSALQEAARARARHEVKAGLPSDHISPTAVEAAEFDPIYGYATINRYSNTISVAY